MACRHRCRGWVDAILLGDFNMEPDSEEYERIAGPSSPYGGRIT